MFDHIGFGVTNLAESKAFFLKALQPLGVEVVMQGPYGVGLGQHRKPSLWLYETAERPAHLLWPSSPRATSRSTRSTRPRWLPAARTTVRRACAPHYHPNYHGAFVIGPDGHNVEAVCHKPVA